MKNEIADNPIAAVPTPAVLPHIAPPIIEPIPGKNFIIEPTNFPAPATAEPTITVFERFFIISIASSFCMTFQTELQ